FFFQAEDGIRDFHVTGVQTCALPILVGTALEATCRFEYIGGKRRIVTDTRFAVEAPLAKAEPGESEVLVRTLGGVIGDLGELVRSEERRVGKERRTRWPRRDDRRRA